MEKLNIGVVCGGFSGEAVISLKSADTILKSLDGSKYNVFKLELNKEGWKVSASSNVDWRINRSDFTLESDVDKIKLDAVVNVIHGTPGEDGKLQGYFELLGVPYTNSDVLASALAFNKGFCNQYLSKNDIKVAESVFLHSKDQEVDEDKIISKLGLPCFVKPNDGGSSLGVTKVRTKGELLPAIEKAFSIGSRVLIESFVNGTEITCGVICWNGKPTAVAVTEIVFESDFFDFNAKYLSKTTQEITPARIPKDVYDTAMQKSVEIYKLLGCRGFFRADYILQNGELFLIEVNTIPGMSAQSLMPQMLDYAGFPLSEVLDQEINLLVQGR
ncbi:MAG: D-alanine--D-alanine ligase [Flavobacteriales bacterium]|nr:D-alanine--D-alanine ligase [Flavobacteriales bacterium]